jgi:hypothetical protein
MEMPVSIHTPVKSVTDTPNHLVWCFGVSIHTPVKSVTRRSMFSLVLSMFSLGVLSMFQPTRP